MKQYMLSVHHAEGEAYPSEEEMQAAFRDVEAFNSRLQAAGSWVFACGLEDASTSTVVDATKGDTVTTDGPFAEAKEHLGGFWVVQAADLDAALALAADASTACQGPVEVRPLQGEEG